MLVRDGSSGRTGCGTREGSGVDSGRYADSALDVPATGQAPGGGAKLRAIDPQRLADKILTACECRRAELVVPSRARLLFAITQISPRLGDWLLQKMTAR